MDHLRRKWPRLACRLADFAKHCCFACYSFAAILFLNVAIRGTCDLAELDNEAACQSKQISYIMFGEHILQEGKAQLTLASYDVCRCGTMVYISFLFSSSRERFVRFHQSYPLLILAKCMLKYPASAKSPRHFKKIRYLRLLVTISIDHRLT